MASEDFYLISFILVAAAATLTTRLLPFAFLGKQSHHPLVQHLGRYLPAGIMALLVVIFLLQSGHWQQPILGLDALIPAGLVVALHLWKRNALLSMLAGTACYMLIQQSFL
ncbi:Branched-chain amino acid transport protein AzlD [Marinospirillum celere]|uniref:Branched-chain amino acid transport protein AzlD n=1 Tax=Marinospirillum celere TaxID=1122252 RepID=A0A1I1E435_9GAMM|nr:AzlD domain-containing protein [Marinospirillum celere]SFB81412.1 Branched-chain amino acid transport protein AzlD [Marinospirillum celere]